jgi:diguanylate cyclase (GGDEF)-like protein
MLDAIAAARWPVTGAHRAVRLACCAFGLLLGCAVLPAADAAQPAPSKPAPPRSATASAGSQETRARRLIDQARSLNETSVREAAALAHQALVLLEKSPDHALRLDASAQLCGSLAVFAPQRALRLAETSLIEARARSDIRAVPRLLGCKGYAQDMAGDIAAAAVTYESAIEAAERLGDAEITATVLAYRGENLQYRGLYDDALLDLNRSYQLYDKAGFAAGKRYTLNALANLYSDPKVGEFDKAIEYYRQLYASDEALGSRAGMAVTTFNIGSAYEEKGELEAALREYRKALQMDTALGERDAIAEEERAIARVLVQQGKALEALPLIDSAMRYFEEVQDSDGRARTLITRTAALTALRRFEEAGQAIEAARVHFERENNLRLLATVHEHRSRLLAASGRWREAYVASGQLREIEQRLEKTLRHERTSRLRVQFDAERKEEQNLALTIENAKRAEALRSAERVRSLQRKLLILGLALLALLAAMALQQVHKNRRMRRLAMTDELTGLPNRRSILNFLGAEWKAADGARRPLSVIAFDIDHFKRINDAQGHAGGDAVLREVATILRRVLRPGDWVGRIGGEEFLLVLPELDRTGAEVVAEALRRELEATDFRHGEASVPVTASFGVSERLPDDAEVDALLKRADDALYRAKAQGRNRVELG